MIFFYLPAIGAIHFLSAAALGLMSVLSGKALRDMTKRDTRERHDDPFG